MGTAPKSRNGRSWKAIDAEAWVTYILKELSLLWLVASRLACSDAMPRLDELETALV